MSTSAARSRSGSTAPNRPAAPAQEREHRHGVPRVRPAGPSDRPSPGPGPPRTAGRRHGAAPRPCPWPRAARPADGGPGVPEPRLVVQVVDRDEPALRPLVTGPPSGSSRRLPRRTAWPRRSIRHPSARARLRSRSAIPAGLSRTGGACHGRDGGWLTWPRNSGRPVGVCTMANRNGRSTVMVTGGGARNAASGRKLTAVAAAASVPCSSTSM